MEKEPIELSIQVNDLTVVIRPLKIEDALTSYRWRNDPEVWKYTGNRPDQVITPEIETEWIKKVLTDKTQFRFAICVKKENKELYIGNAHFSGIANGEAEYHMFIGEKSYWGKGIGVAVSRAIHDFGFKKLGIRKITGRVRIDNCAAMKMDFKAGFIVDPNVFPNPQLINGVYWLYLVKYKTTESELINSENE